MIKIMKKGLSKVTLFIIMVLSITLVGCKSNGTNKFQSGLGSGLDGDITNWAIIPDDGDSQAMIELAVKLYENANELDKNISYRKLSTYGEITAGALCNRYIFNVKNQNEWYFSEAQYSDDAFANLFSPPFLTLKYGTLDYGKAVVMNCNKNISVDKESGNPCANLANVVVSEESLPVFHSSQDGKYQQTDFEIRLDTVKSARVSHNDEGGFYIVIIELDVNNEEAIAKPLANLRETVKDGKYTSCVEYIEIWDSGHYRYFNAVDHWTGKVVVTINATIDYKSYYSYDEEECDVSKYYGIENLKELINK